jgi:putative two-component system response regulator
MHTILIVDDERAGRETLEVTLLSDSYRLVMAENGRQALEMARDVRPDVILLDVMMPGMTGFDVCRAIRSDQHLAEIPILILTALDDRRSLMEGLEAGADDFITKPFDRLELRARLATITRLNRYRKLVDERAQLELANREIMDAYEATIEGWSRAMDLRDKETEGHTQRVTSMTIELARRLGIDESQIVHMRRGALLHDMGKMGVPDEILRKPGKLTDEEWVIMRMHPVYAYEMLSPIAYLKPAVDIPYCHHEKWDGSGYPRGLCGEAIPLAARLFALVDVWDALHSDRPYRAAWAKEQILQYIREQSGRHFDPALVDVFCELAQSPEFASQ